MSDFNVVEPDELAKSPLSFQLEGFGLSAIDAEFLTRIIVHGGFICCEDDSTPLYSPIMMEYDEFVDRIVSDSPDIEIADSDKNTLLLDSIKNLVSKYYECRDAMLLAIMAHLADTYIERKLGIFPPVYNSNWWKQFLKPSDPFKPIVWEKALKEYLEISSNKITIKFFKSLISTLPRDQKDFWLSAIDWSLLRDNSVPIHERKKDPRCFGFWFHMARSLRKVFENEKVCDFIFTNLEKESEETIGVVAFSLASEMAQTISLNEHLADTPWDSTCVNRDKSIVDLLIRKLETSESDELLKRAIVRFMILEGRSNIKTKFGVPLISLSFGEDDHLDLTGAAESAAPQETDFLPTAKKELGQIRRLLKIDSIGEFDPSNLYAPLSFLFRFDSPTTALELLLTYFSACEYQMVADDLRYWKESGRDDPPEPYRWIADRIAEVIHSLKDEQEDDPRLREIRTSLALFFIKRLKTRNMASEEVAITDDSFVENRWVWRYFYIRALRELKINPKGSGHKTLRWVSDNDPHEEVRAEAKKAYKELRHQVSLPSQASPRKALFAAFWWLRQAHLTTLGIKIDPQGAQRTRSKEVTYTKRY